MGQGIQSHPGPSGSNLMKIVLIIYIFHFNQYISFIDSAPDLLNPLVDY